MELQFLILLPAWVSYRSSGPSVLWSYRKLQYHSEMLFNRQETSALPQLFLNNVIYTEERNLKPFSPLKYAYRGKQSGCNRTPRWSRENFISSADPQSLFSPFSSLHFYISRNSARVPSTYTGQGKFIGPEQMYWSWVRCLLCTTVTHSFLSTQFTFFFQRNKHTGECSINGFAVLNVSRFQNAFMQQL